MQVSAGRRDGSAKPWCGWPMACNMRALTLLNSSLEMLPLPSTSIASNRCSADSTSTMMSLERSEDTDFENLRCVDVSVWTVLAT